jgi:hypothetical protein
MDMGSRVKTGSTQHNSHAEHTKLTWFTKIFTIDQNEADMVYTDIHYLAE